MKKSLIVILVFIFIIVGLLINSKEDEELRVRIIPNSNENYDLLVKEEVKKFTIEYLQCLDIKDYNDGYNKIKNTYNSFESLVNKNITKVNITFSNHTLYNKTYNNNALVNKEAMTLYIVIGEGKGDNWWGSIYPEFLEISSSQEVKYESLLINIIKSIKGD